MSALRARLSAIVTLWLLSHAVTLAAVPFALCCRVEMMAVVHANAAEAGADAGNDTTDADCPLHAQHGTAAVASAAASAGADAVAPLEDADADATACTMRGICSPLNIALESLLGALAVLPEAPATVIAETSTALVLPLDVLHSHASRLTSPPPRA